MFRERSKDQERGNNSRIFLITSSHKYFDRCSAMSIPKHHCQMYTKEITTPMSLIIWFYLPNTDKDSRLLNKSNNYILYFPDLWISLTASSRPISPHSHAFKSPPSHLATSPWGIGPVSWTWLAGSRSGPGWGWRLSSTPRLLQTAGGPSHLQPCG